jgi:CBS domain-containing protein
MRRHKVGCLPVVEDDRLVGIVTEHDFIEIATRLLEEELRAQ